MARKNAAIASESDSQSTELTSKYAHLSESDKGLVLHLAAEQKTQTQIAQVIGCSQSTISEFLRKVSAPAKVVQQVLKSHELQAVEHWASAVKVAAKRGDHRPARELIEAANPELRPQQQAQGSTGVVINIGMPGAPLEPPTIVIASTPGAAANAPQSTEMRLEGGAGASLALGPSSA